MTRKLLVTGALPYANGPVHLGHLLEEIQVDVFVRAHRMLGNEAVFVCASDTHGTPIELNARKQGITPEELVARSHAEHQATFRDFYIYHDHYGSTHNEANRHFAELFYARIKAAGRVSTKDVEQMYDPKEKRFLPDRFVRGTCPRCKAEDQNGDACEKCGSTYEARELLNPRSVISGETPVLKNSVHYFYNLPDAEAAVRAWLDRPGGLQPDVRNFAESWLKDGLKAWDISRDGPYFGFKIPGEENKYFYVWLDAPIGYVAACHEWCEANGRKVEEFWGPDSDADVYHFIGKDILYFHILFWPALLTDAGFRLPTAVHAHGMLTANGEKLSKSRGTFINGRTYLNHLPPEMLRYYLCSKFSARVEDLDLNFDDFIGRVNGELVNNVTNLVSRSLQIVTGKLDGKIPPLSAVKDTAAADKVRAFEKHGLAQAMGLFTDREYAQAIRKVLDLTDWANKYIQDSAPWALLKTDPARAGEVLSVALNAAKLASVALHPVLPRFTDAVGRMLKQYSGKELWQPLVGRDGKADLGGDTVYGPFERLFDRAERKAVDAIVEESRPKDAPPAAAPAKPAAKKVKQPPSDEPPPECSFEDFARLDLRIGMVTAAAPVDGSDKLLQLTVDLGPLGNRNVLAGIRHSYQPKDLMGRRVLVLANLAPRKMKFGVSQAMVLAADRGEFCAVLSPDTDVEPGARVR